MYYDEAIKAVWKEYVLGKKTDLSKTRPVIRASWERCRGKVDAFQKSCPLVLSTEETEKRRASSRELISVARPVIKKVYDYVADSGFVIMLCDGEGYCLERIGDEDVLKLLDKANFVEGSSLAENILGTNAVGTAIYTNQPIQIYSYEHWCISVQVGTCSAAPIHDPDTGKIIGVLDMTGTYDKVHSHTLGMVVAAAFSITGQIAVQRNWERAMLADQYKSLIMESISEGLIAIDNLKVITHINARAIQFLDLNENPSGQNVYAVLRKHCGSHEGYSGLRQLIDLKETVVDELVSVRTASRAIKCMVTTSCLLQDQKIIGKIIVLDEISRADKLVSRVVGGQARFCFADLIGNDTKFIESIGIAVQASKTKSNILLLGESGTGKDLYAQAIHNSSSRKDGPYIAINCAAIPRELLGSELFGYVEGAFTGARRGGSPGKFELANGGTMFLDEIGDMPLDMQTSLLRVIEEKTVMRIGGSEVIPVDVRIIAATNKDLSHQVALGNFRDDLYYRLNVISIKLPPLRERKRDIPELIEHLAGKIGKNLGKSILEIEPDFIAVCLVYDWPGNVRELCNVIERAISLAKDPVLSVRNFPPALLQMTDLFQEDRSSASRRIEAATLNAQKRLITDCLEKCNGNRSMAAKELGIARSTLYRKLQKIGF